MRVHPQHAAKGLAVLRGELEVLPALSIRHHEQISVESQARRAAFQR